MTRPTSLGRCPILHLLLASALALLALHSSLRIAPAQAAPDPLAEALLAWGDRVEQADAGARTAAAHVRTSAVELALKRMRDVLPPEVSLHPTTGQPDREAALRALTEKAEFLRADRARHDAVLDRLPERASPDAWRPADWLDRLHAFARNRGRQALLDTRRQIDRDLALVAAATEWITRLDEPPLAGSGTTDGPTTPLPASDPGAAARPPASSPPVILASEDLREPNLDSDDEARQTDEVRRLAESAARRAEAERTRARTEIEQAIAADWEVIAPALAEVEAARRDQEVRLAALHQQRALLAEERQDLTERVNAVRAASADDPARAERADDLWALVAERRADRRLEILRLVADLRLLRPAVDAAAREHDLAADRLEAALADRTLLDNPALRERVRDVRQAHLELAQRRLDLARLRLSTREAELTHQYRRIQFYSRRADELVPLMSSARRNALFTLTSASLDEETSNLADRLLGVPALFRDRAERLALFTSWLATVEGLRWLLKFALVLLALFAVARLVRTFRDDAFLAVIRRLDDYRWFRRRADHFLKAAEILRDITWPLAWLGAFLAVWGRLPDLPEFRAIDAIVTTALLWHLVARAIRTLVVPRSESGRPEFRGNNFADFGVDVLDISPARVALVLRTTRVWQVWAVASVILLETVAFFLGIGLLHFWLSRLLLAARVALLYLLVWWWRDGIVDAFLARPEVANSPLGAFVDARRNRAWSVVYLVAIALWMLAARIARWSLDRLRDATLVRNVRNFIFRKRVELAQDGEDLSARPDAWRDLPLKCQALLNVDDAPPWIDPEFLAPRPRESAALLDSLDRWLDGRSTGSIALVGERGTGITSLLLATDDALRARAPTSTVSITTRLNSRDDLQRLLDALGVGDHDLDDAASVDRDTAPRRIVVIDNAERLFLRSVGGFDALSELARVIQRTSRNIAWILAFELNAWHFLRRTIVRDPTFDTVISVLPLPSDDLQNALLARTRAAGVEPTFRALTQATASRISDDGSAWGVIKSSEGFFRILADYARGNPTVAMHFWLRSLVPGSDGDTDVVLFQRPAPRHVARLGENALFLLAAIAQHGDLSADDLATVVAIDPAQVDAELHALREAGILLTRGGTFRIAVRFLRAVTDRLREENLLFSRDP